jgi:hypothetical protein
VVSYSSLIGNVTADNQSAFYLNLLSVNDKRFCTARTEVQIHDVHCFTSMTSPAVLPFKTAAACEWYAFVAALCGFNSIGTMALIAVDRYRFIARPFEMLYKATSVRSVTKILAVWVWSVLCTCPPLLGWGRYIPEGFQASVTPKYDMTMELSESFKFSSSRID